MASGIAVNEAFEKSYKELNMRKHSIIVLSINKEMTMVNVEKTIGNPTDPEADWKSFVKTLPENDCRFIVTDFQVKDTPTVTKSKICMILWSPEYAPVRSKMIYAASREAVASKAGSIQRNIQATEMSELVYNAVKEQVFK